MKTIFLYLFVTYNLLALNNIGNIIVKDADQHIGMKYIWGGNNLKFGVDCSSFVQLLFKKEGINLPRTAKGQALYKKYPLIKGLNKIRLGDALYFKNETGHIHHVAIVTGFDKNHRAIITHAKGKKFGIIKELISDKYISEFIGAKRFYITKQKIKKITKQFLRPIILKTRIN